ncbi:chondroitinase-B domain-containing protein [Simiduia agarivorans]|uniref:Poly(Beta-D-mannuronate) lyase n=1 Tax=Simiduia agarivorans (strain DSM 21679 / JCM 13881 / BCRC 17597 / SA1) TaxID=1117647 RepID=K4KMF7_SIMAS|nr:chondroitinase-B domain-containing protein [Simiduia agarivorans]AFU99263.1 Poly(beta-D-mannuronate) lyase [Simiduia agarivorans SA1 = DSM 21679]
MFQKTLLTLAIGAALTACGGGDNSYSNTPGSVEISGFTGSPSVGDVLTATVSDADGVVADSVLYGWYANGAAISGADAATFTVTNEYVGQTLQVKVSYQGENGLRESTASTVTDAVPASLTINATFVHGLVEGGSCSLFPLTDTGEKGTALGSGMTASGVLTFAGVEYQGPALVECSGGTYIDEATGSSLTAPLTRAVVNVDGDADFVVSPLTELATQLALADAAGLLSALTTYNNDVAQWFGLEYVPAGATAPVTIDITAQAPADLQAGAIGNDAAGLYATALALVSQLDENTSGDASAVVSALASDLEDGSFSVQTLQDLAAAQMDLASSAVAANLNQAALDALAGSIGIVNTEGSVSIQGSASVGSSLQAIVSDANGVGSVSYQWLVDGVAASGETAASYNITAAVLGSTLSVTASYTDNAGFSEQLTSASTAAVTTDATDFDGVAGAISGTLVVGEALTVAAPTDANGISGSVSYQWMADGQAIANANASSYTLTAAEVGAAISVTASYTDDDGFDESLTSSADGIVYSALVSNKAELASAVGAAASGDVIGVQAGDYANMPELSIGDGVTVQAVAGQAPIVSGTSCIVLGAGSVLDGMTFNDLSLSSGSSCASTGPASVYMEGSGAVLSNNTFNGQADASGEYHYVSLKGFQSVIERNVFAAKNAEQKGSAITIYVNNTPDNNEGHSIRYNLFKDFTLPSGDIDNRNSSGYAIQLGRSTSSDGKEDGLTTIEYNLFSNVNVDRRLIKVQSSRNTIRYNTVVNSTGQIALEDGFGSTVDSNIIISAGDDKDDGGISFAPLGHTISNNYINNIRTTSSQRAALLVNSEVLTGDGNGAVIADGSINKTLTISNNTVVNAQYALQFGSKNCGLASIVIDVDGLLIANQDSANSINGNTNGSGRTAVIDDCAIEASSDYDNVHIYSDTLSKSGSFNFKQGMDGNLFGAENGATLTTPDANNMVEGAGPDAGIGADLDALIYISEDMVGPGSSWTAD